MAYADNSGSSTDQTYQAYENTTAEYPSSTNAEQWKAIHKELQTQRRQARANATDSFLTGLAGSLLINYLSGLLSSSSSGVQKQPTYGSTWRRNG